MTGRTLLRLSEGSFATAIEARNAINRVRLMDLGGFFDRVYLSFFRAGHDRTHQISARHVVIDNAVVGSSGWFHRTRAEIGFVARMVRLVRSEHVCAVYANDPFLAGINALIVSSLTRVPYVVEIVADYDLSFSAGRRAAPYLPGRALEKMAEKLVLSRASAVMADRRHYLDYALRNGARPERAAVTACVTDSFYYSARPIHALESYVALGGRKALVYIGRLSAEKYTLDLVDCLARVVAAGEDAALVIAGDGPLRDEMRALAEAKGVAKRLFLLGNRPAQELVDLMAGADVLVFTHAGYTLVEGALSGSAIVAYDFEWHPELITEGVTGLLARFRDTADLARQVLRVLRDDGLATTLADAARRRVLAEHMPEHAIEKEIEIYERIFKDGPCE